MAPDSFIIVDLEATCWPGRYDPARMETIEIGAVRMASARGPVLDEFDSYVRPVAEPTLSDFCTSLTSIRQSDVDAAETFEVVLPRFLRWIGPEPYRLCSWGAYDVRQLRRDCERHGISFPVEFERGHVNVKERFASMFGLHRPGMAEALRHAGLPLEGTHHRGIDDARNIARLAMIVLGESDPG